MRTSLFALLLIALVPLGLTRCSLVRNVGDLSGGQSTCAVDCLGGACVDHRCQPITIAANRKSPWGVAVDEGGVYWSEPVSDTPGKILTATADGKIEAVLTSDVSPTWISLYGGRVQWTAFDNPGVVGSCALGVAGGKGCILSLTDPQIANPADSVVAYGIDETASPDSVVQDETGVYWTSGDAPDGVVVTCSAATCTADTVRALATGQATPRGLTVDHDYVYWVNEGSNDSATGEILRIAKSASDGTPEVLVSNQASPGYIARVGDRLFWTTHAGPGGGAVVSASTSGQDVTVVAANQQGALGIAADESGVYWTNYTPSGSVSTCPLAGCGDAPSVLATSQSLPFAIAVDKRAVYWTLKDSAAGGVMKVAKDAR